MRLAKIIIAACVALLCVSEVAAQSPKLKDGKIQFALNEDESQYVRLTFCNQVWFRYTETNPGTTLYGEPINEVSDIGLRRLRLQLYGQISERVFFYTQFGQNNFSYLSERFEGSFFHDAVVEFTLHPKAVSLGGGLAGWSGLSRYASPSIGSIMPMDAPLYQQATNGVNDQFIRKLSFYAKGKLGKLDYRLAISKPLAVQNANAPVAPLGLTSDFSTLPAKWQQQGYLMYQFLDQEANTTPYNAGCYLGSKRVLNLGAGYILQQDAMWRLSSVGDTLIRPLQLFGVDVFYDTPLNEEKGNALTAYLAVNSYNFGRNYLRNIGVMNPANGTNANGTVGGGGNGFPGIGTGTIFYGQLGYLFGDKLLGDHGKLQVYACAQVGDFEALDAYMIMAEGGFNWFIRGTQNSKLSLNYQSRPVFDANSAGDLRETTRKGMMVLQYHVAI